VGFFYAWTFDISDAFGAAFFMDEGAENEPD
jgi:hypothetical protein